MTVKEQLQQLVSEMSEEEAADALALVAGAAPTDVYGTAWGRVLDGTDLQALTVTGKPSIEIPNDVPGIA